MSATTDTTPKTKGGWWALSPLAVFLCLYLVTSLLVNDFYKVPITIAFMGFNPHTHAGCDSISNNIL